MVKRFSMDIHFLPDVLAGCVFCVEERYLILLIRRKIVLPRQRIQIWIMKLRDMNLRILLHF